MAACSSAGPAAQGSRRVGHVSRPPLTSPQVGGSVPPRPIESSASDLKSGSMQVLRGQRHREEARSMTQANPGTPIHPGTTVAYRTSGSFVGRSSGFTRTVRPPSQMTAYWSGRGDPIVLDIFGKRGGSGSGIQFLGYGHDLGWREVDLSIPSPNGTVSTPLILSSPLPLCTDRGSSGTRVTNDARYVVRQRCRVNNAKSRWRIGVSVSPHGPGKRPWLTAAMLTVEFVGRSLRRTPHMDIALDLRADGGAVTARLSLSRMVK